MGGTRDLGPEGNEHLNQVRLSTLDLKRHYRRGPHTVRALDGVSLELRAGEFLVLVGSSGSGKSTLLNLVAGLDRPSGGQVRVKERTLSEMSERDLALYRARRTGMIFQAFNLIGHYTALENVALALAFNGTPRARREEVALSQLEALGLAERADHRPADLSGGEQQRVAVARALVTDPEMLFADEPTGNLDQDNSEQIAELLASLCGEGRSVLMTTHDLELAGRYAHRILRLNYGRIEEERELPGNRRSP